MADETIPAPEPETKGGDLKLFGEIQKRVETLGPDAKFVLRTALRLGLKERDAEVVRQVVERHGALSARGRAYVEGELDVHTIAAK